MKYSGYLPKSHNCQMKSENTKKLNRVKFLRGKANDLVNDNSDFYGFIWYINSFAQDEDPLADSKIIPPGGGEEIVAIDPVTDLQ